MRYNLNITSEKEAFLKRSKELIESKCMVELKRVIKSRTDSQNKALHLYFTFIANELNELGLQFQYTGISGKVFELRYTPDLVKEYIWRPIQMALFDIKSTTKINTQQMNEIIDVITNFFAEREVVLEFPSIESMIDNE